MVNDKLLAIEIPRLPGIVDKTANLREYFLDVYERYAYSKIEQDVQDMRKGEEQTGAAERMRLKALLEMHYSASIVWVRSRFERRLPERKTALMPANLRTPRRQISARCLVAFYAQGEGHCDQRAQPSAVHGLPVREARSADGHRFRLRCPPELTRDSEAAAERLHRVLHTRAPH